MARITGFGDTDHNAWNSRRELLHKLLQGALVSDDQCRALNLDQFLLLEVGKQPADRFASGADHFRDFLVRERQPDLILAIGLRRVP